MVSADGVGNVPQNMWDAFKLLQNIYKEPLVPMNLGVEEHGAYTDMNSITVGVDNMKKTIMENYHEVPDEYKAGSSYFTVGHEFGHITTHPGKDSDYWMNGANNFSIESGNRQKWLNVLSDIMVNWSVMTGSNIRETNVGDKITEDLRYGFRAGFNNACTSDEGLLKHRKLLKENKLVDNRFKPLGKNRGEYTNADPSNPMKPTVNTPLFERFQGHGRGPQYYPAISYATKKNLNSKYRKVEITKSVNGVSKGSKHTVKETISFDGRKNAEYEPIHYYVLENGKQINARYAIPLCPDCGSRAGANWDFWWGYKWEGYNQELAQKRGTYIHLMTQLFVYQWAAIYSTFLPYNGKMDRNSGKQFLKDIAETMDLVMGEE